MQRGFYSIFFALSLLVFVACIKRNFEPKETEVQSLMDPHRLPEQGPWFEGWYLRITPVDRQQRSLGIIVGSFLPSGVERRSVEASGLKGYAAILYGGDENTPLRSFESFPDSSDIFLDNAEPVSRDPSPKGAASFRWFANGIGAMTQHGAQINIPNVASIQVQLTDVVSWNQSGLGPEGIISLFRSFPLHWFVYSLQSKVQYSATLPSSTAWLNQPVTIKGEGYAHFEKNWGVAFPPAYVWMQASDTGNKKSIALAGGHPFELGPAKPEAWLVGFRGAKNSVDFAPQNVGTIFESKVDACAGFFELTSSFLNRRLKVSAKADRRTFGGIAIPTGSGFQKNGSEQSFQTNVVAKLYEVSPFSSSNASERLLEETTFENGALEFGSKFECR